IEVAIGFYALDFARVTSRDESFDLTGGAPALNGGSARASAGSSTVSFSSVSVTTTSVQPDPTTPTLPPPISRTNYQLVWSDEFNGTSVDASKWNKVGPWGIPVASHWSGHFSYNTSNVSEANGSATITVHNTGGGPLGTWTGGVLSTNTTKLFQYGFFEVRAKLPAGQGFWPAIWMYGSNSSDDELDIMEFLGGDKTTVYQTMHESSGALEQVAPTSTDWTSGYHLFQMLWEPGQVTFYIDNVETASFTTNVPAEPMYLMLNFDVGGPNDWGGAPNSSTPTTVTFNVDYVRVYQQP
ncbi:MAG TPA: glycoside hydrolase family 16 protein, partial [Isosphaeraceae bacterium]|nr:glycoside hydrolase family 16 protein [Isosphaeraceae bacterium]